MKHEFTIGHLFGGLGGGAYGAQKARVALGDHEATFRTLGSVDVDPAGCRDFEYLCDAPATVADLHSMTPAQLRAAWGDWAPDMVLLSPPCKGFSALLSKKSAKAPKYQALNELVLKGIFLVCSTWDEPPPIIFLENVPRITSRGRDLLAKARQLLTAHGYVVTGDDYHDCGELGGLAQRRRRFFLVARCARRIPNLLYQPPTLRVRACGEVLAPLPTPGDEGAGGPLHRLPRISWLTWVRLALIPAGGDWRDLPGVVPEGSTRREVHRRHHVADWDEPSATVAGSGSNGVNHVADPRIGLAQTAVGAASFKGRPGLFGVNPWEDPVPTVTGGASVTGSNAVAAVADPRVEIAPKKGHRDYLGVKAWTEPSGVVTGGAAPTRGAFSVADPRLRCRPRAGAYGVLGWQEAAATISGALAIDNGSAAVADPRLPPGAPIGGIPANPKRAPDFTPVILAADGTWHRPLTTLELAVLQGFPAFIDGKPLVLDGRSSSAWRERIGNAIPPPSAQAIASETLLTLLAAKLGRFVLSSNEVWVEPVEVIA